MAETIREMISEEKVDERIRELGRQISEDYAGKQIHLICVLKGGVFFMCELAKRINVPVSMDFMCVGSYGDGTASSGVVRIAKDLDELSGMGLTFAPMCAVSDFFLFRAFKTSIF